jgi:hypothetical protein
VDPVPDPPFLRKYGSSLNRNQTSGPVARNSDHYTTEAVLIRPDYKDHACCLNRVDKNKKIWSRKLTRDIGRYLFFL